MYELMSKHGSAFGLGEVLAEPYRVVSPEPCDATGEFVLADNGDMTVADG